MSNQDLNCRNDLLERLADRVLIDQNSILILYWKNQWYLAAYGILSNDSFIKGKMIIQQCSCLFKQKKYEYTMPHLFRVYIYWRESNTISLEAVETERRNRLFFYLYLFLVSSFILSP